MRRVFDTMELLGEVGTAQGEYDLCAQAKVYYHEESGKLEVDLDAFLRTTDIRIKEWRLASDWLPNPEHIRESAASEETGDLAREGFQRWVRKVRESVPTLKTLNSSKNLLRFCGTAHRKSDAKFAN